MPTLSRPSLPTRLLREALIYGYYTGRPHALNPIHHVRAAHERRARVTLEQQHPSLMTHLSAMIAASDSVGCSYADYLGLYQTLMASAPATVLECGSGVSSCVIAYTLRALKKQTGRATAFVSMEESSFFHDQVKRIFSSELATEVEFVQSDRVERNYHGLLGASYRAVPRHAYDFLYIDGPTLRRAPGGAKCFSADLIELLLGATDDRPLDALIDQRIGTYWAFKALMPETRVRYDVIRQVVWVNGARRSALRRPLLERGTTPVA